MTEPLLQAYKDLLTRAPGAAFRRARSLYLNKYPLPEASGQHALRLFVCNEQLVETMEPANDGNKAHRIVTLTTTVVQFALVHWQRQDAPADEAIAQYLRRQWEIDSNQVLLEPQAESWFREGGHQLRFSPPQPICIQQRTLLTLAEEN